MKELIPFKKEIVFKTRIAELTNISLEHDYKIKEDLIEGEFFLSGEYKMTEASMVREDFFHKIPFTIAITKQIKKESINLTLNDFSYDINNEDTLALNIEMMLEFDEEQIVEEEVVEDDRIEDVIDDMLFTEEEETKEETLFKEKEIIEKVDLEMPVDIKPIIEERNEVGINSILESVSDNNEYVTYKIYLAKENDSFESVSLKYDIEESELRKYNKSDSISIGDKIIIPYNFDE